MKRQLVTELVLLALFVQTFAVSVVAQETKVDPVVATEAGKVLDRHRVAEPPLQTRGSNLPELYRNSVRSVPLVISSDGIGSSVVIIVNQNRQGWLITNHHVIDHPFTTNGVSTVLLLFYDPALKNNVFDKQQFADCIVFSRDQSDWCQAVRRFSRSATVVRSDPARDLALLKVDDVPSGINPFQPSDIKDLQPGTEVAVIGHPQRLLWSLTTGIISAVRTNLSSSNGMKTVIQTQTPVNPGNSGGPLIGADGKLAGVVFGVGVGQRVKIGNEDLTVPSQGLNYAIGVDDVLEFTRGKSQ
jgi:S1-C subfamily serine protease